MSYITLNELSNDLGIFEYEIRTTTPTGTFAVDDTLTGVTSTETMVISRKISATKYFVNLVSGKFTLAEVIGNGVDTAKILNSDAIALQLFINRAQSIIELITRKKMLNTGTSHTIRRTTHKNSNMYTFPAGKLPIISITSITSDNVAYTGSEANGYFLDSTNGIIDFSDGTQAKTAGWYGNLVIEYLYGVATATVADIPPAMIEGLLNAVVYMWDRLNQLHVGPGATSINPAGFAMSFKQDELFDEAFIKLATLDSRMLGL